MAEHIKDEGWAWFVFIACSINMFLLTSCLFGFSVLLVKLPSSLDCSLAAVAAIGSINMAISTYFNVFSGALIQRYGARPVAISGGLLISLGLACTAPAPSVYVMYLTYGLCTGAGMSMVSCSVICIIPDFFDRHRPLATGMLSFGFSIAVLATPPLLQLTIDEFGWQNALLLQAALTLNIVPFSLTFTPVKQNGCHKHPDSKKPKWIDMSLFREKRFMLYCLAIFFVKYGTMSFYQHFVNAAVSKGVDIKQASLLPLIQGTTSLLIRILMSFIANLPGTNRMLMFSVANMACSFVQASIFLAHNFTAMSAVAVAIGFSTGSMVVDYTLVFDLIGGSRLPHAYGIFSVSYGTAMMISSPITGYLVLILGGYGIPMVINGLINAIGSLLAMSLFLHSSFSRNKTVSMFDKS